MSGDEERSSTSLADLAGAVRLIQPALAQLAASVREGMDRFNETIVPLIQAWGAYAGRTNLAHEAGWLPHATTPIDLLDETSMSPEQADGIIEAHYRDNWPSVRAKFIDAIEDLEIGDGSKRSYREAIDAHEHGLYRASVRLLMPEIERAARDPVYDGIQRVPANLRKFREAIGRLPAGIVLQEQHGIRQFFTLVTHVYLDIGENHDLRMQAEETTVPNRHACIHGLVDYSTAQHSINALIIVGFAFQMIDAIIAHPESLNPRAGVDEYTFKELASAYREIFPASGRGAKFDANERTSQIQ